VKLRIFIAHWPGEAVRTAIAEHLARLSSLAGRSTATADWHLTMIFLGEREEATLANLVDTVASLTWPRIALSFDTLGTFERARVLWLGASSVPASLEITRSALLGALEQRDLLGSRPEPFVPHITLARQFPPGAELTPLSGAVPWTIGTPQVAFARAPGQRRAGERRYHLVPSH
jgi:RNA 2',3'-cyclic 3'-phosphodiesterase